MIDYNKMTNDQLVRYLHPKALEGEPIDYDATRVLIARLCIAENNIQIISEENKKLGDNAQTGVDVLNALRRVGYRLERV